MKVKLSDWAAANYSPAPSMWTLRQWIKRGQLYPPPELVGSTYYIEDSARRQITSRPTVAQRMRATA